MLKLVNGKFFLFLIFLLFLAITSIKISAQNYYWVAFTDKNNTPYSLSNPEEYLSERAILRRTKQDIPIDSFDIPVNTEYIQQILEKGAQFTHASKWLNGITVSADSSFFSDSVMHLPFVKEVMLTKPAPGSKSAVDKFFVSSSKNDTLSIDSAYYGNSVLQIGQLNGQYLHNLGYLGEGLQIAVIDAGFYRVDSYSAFDSLWFYNRILGIRDFVNPGSDIFTTNYHGMSVLSCMAGNVPGELVGTAPDASYWLLRSEDTGSEYIIEEDHWAVAAEFADSVGADIINSSLAYSEFNDQSTNHTYAEMDGKTTRVTRAANIAASRGMLVFCSAGNEGDDPWKYIAAPADGKNVIAVGAVDANGIPSGFSSYGPSSDGDVKPNVAAMGSHVYLQISSGEFGFNSGTSFASPVLAGMGACLWQAHPNATAVQIKQSIEQSASLYPGSNTRLGYGIPDMVVADQILQTSDAPGFNKEHGNWIVYPNPVQDYLVLRNTKVFGQISVSIYSLEGRLILQEKMRGTNEITIRNLDNFPDGLLILKIESDESTETLKLSKIR